MAPLITVTARVTDSTGAFGEAVASANIGNPWDAAYASGLSSTPRSTVTTSGNITLSTDGQVYQNKELPNARISVTGKNITIENVWPMGGTPPSSGGVGLIQATNEAAETLVVKNCLLQPRIISPYWNGFNGHDFTMEDTQIRYCQDGIQVKNAALPAHSLANVRIARVWIRDQIWWTAPTTGIVHPSDINTHPDCIQLMQHGNIEIEDCVLNADPAQQVGHWITTLDANGNQVTAPQGTLPAPDGGPFRPIPDRNLPAPWGAGTTTINGQPSTEANGRYRFDDQSCIMFGDEQGKPTFGVRIKNVLCLNGVFAINGGGNHPLANTPDLGVFEDVVFNRGQGSRPSEAATSTIRFDGSGWRSDQVQFIRCRYEDGAPITVRGLAAPL